MESLTVEQLLDELARPSAVPGAGPAASLVAAVAAALVAMAARASRGAWPAAGAAAAQARALGKRALELGQEDVEAVEAYLAARSGDDEPRPEARNFRLGLALDRAADVPLAIAETAADIAVLAAHVAEHCKGDLQADAAAAAMLAHGAAQAAGHLVEVNLAAGTDEVRISRTRDLVRTAARAAGDSTAAG